MYPYIGFGKANSNMWNGKLRKKDILPSPNVTTFSDEQGSHIKLSTIYR